MRNRFNPTKRFLSLVITILLVLTASLVFGQVLGSLYLDNLALHPNGGLEAKPTNGTKGNINVLRLKAITYYTIEVASYQEREKAVQVGNILAEQGMPVVITGRAPFRVKLGFLNQKERLKPLAQVITVDGQKAKVVEETINSLAYKFPQGDVLATERIAPYIGQVSLVLEKAALLNKEIDCSQSPFGQTKPKFIELAEDIVALTLEGQEVAALLQAENPQQASCFNGLVAALSKWATSVKELELSWNEKQLLISQQHTLAVIEEYQSFLQLTN